MTAETRGRLVRWAAVTLFVVFMLVLLVAALEMTSDGLEREAPGPVQHNAWTQPR